MIFGKATMINVMIDTTNATSETVISIFLSLLNIFLNILYSFHVVFLYDTMRGKTFCTKIKPPSVGALNGF